MSVCQGLFKPNKSLSLLQLQKLISFQYRNKFSGEDRFFRSIDQLVGDSEFVCDVEMLAQVLAKKGNKVFRYATQWSEVMLFQGRNAFEYFLDPFNFYLLILE